MAAAARQGLPVLYAGGHGTGPWGDLVRAALAAEGIGLLRPPDQSRDTGFDVALVESDAERTFVTSLGAESISAPGSWDAVPAGPGDAVYVSGYGLVAPGSGAVLGAWAAALPPGALLFVDPGPLAAQIPDAVLDPVLARCDWLSCNAREAALLSGGAAPEEAARRLLARTARASVIVRVGPDGCFLAARPPALASRRPSPRLAPAPPPAFRPARTAFSGRPRPCLPARPRSLSRRRADPVCSRPALRPAYPRAGGGRGGHDRGRRRAFRRLPRGLADGLSPTDAARRANAAAALAVTRPGPPPARLAPSWTPGSPVT